MHSKVDVAVMIGSGVPASLRALGQSVCWVVLVNGERRGTAYSSRNEAEACKACLVGAIARRNDRQPALCLRLVNLMHAQVQVVDHPRPVGVLTQLFFEEACLLRGPELGIDEFLVVGQGGMAGDEIVNGSLAGIQAELVEQAFQVVGR
jgi:hypothetical protein